MDLEEDKYVSCISLVNNYWYHRFNFITKMGKKVLAIYSLFMNNDMKDLTIENEYMDIVYVNLICQKQWVFFFWEKGYKD